MIGVTLHNLLGTVDKLFLEENDGVTRPKTDFIFTASDRSVMRQYECGSQPCLLLSKFFQLNEPTIHETLFVISARLAKMRETSFMMFHDISHSEIADLSKRTRSVRVVTSDHVDTSSDGQQHEVMDICIQCYHTFYAVDMSRRCGLTIDEEGTRAKKLPYMMACAALLNPMLGGTSMLSVMCGLILLLYSNPAPVSFLSGQKNIMAAGLMDIEQYRNAEKDLLSWIQSILEAAAGVVVVPQPLELADDSSDDDNDDPIVITHSTMRDRALEEYRTFCNVCKKRRNRPRSYCGTTLKLEQADKKTAIEMGKVATKGKDIEASHPFVSCNLASFIRVDGRFDLLRFFEMQQKCFPTLYKIAVCISSVRTNEVGCERFFSMAGYVSCPRRTRLKVRNYECLSMLRANMQSVYIDEKWVAEKYISMEKSKSWDDLESKNDMLVLELERELLAEQLGVGLSVMPQVTSEDNVLSLDADEDG